MEVRCHRWPWVTTQEHFGYLEAADCQNIQIYCICCEINHSRTIISNVRPILYNGILHLEQVKVIQGHVTPILQTRANISKTDRHNVILNIITKLYVLYRTTWFPMILVDLVGHFSCSKPMWIQSRGNIWLLLRDYQRILNSKFIFRNKNEGLLNATDGYVRYASANTSETE